MTVYLVAAAVFFAVFWLVTMLRYRGIYTSTKNKLTRSNSYIRKQFYFLWIITSDLCTVVARLRAASKEISDEFERARLQIERINKSVDDINKRLEQEEQSRRDGAPRDTDLLLKPLRISKVETFDAPDITGVIGYSERVVEDISTLTSIWKKKFKVQSATFSLMDLVANDITALKPLAERAKDGVHILLTDAFEYHCRSDPGHVSRCFRAVLTQAIKQTRRGVVRVSLMSFAPILSSKSVVEIRVTDASQGCRSKDGKFLISPDNYKSNPGLAKDPSSMLRLNIAKYTMRALGGELRFDLHEQGNMTFVLRFYTELYSAEAT